MHGEDSQISWRVIHEESALRGADPCNALAYATTSGRRSKIICRGAKVMLGALLAITGCLSRRFSSDFARAFHGGICRHVSAIGKLFISALTGGPRMAFSIVFSSSWPAITITNT